VAIYALIGIAAVWISQGDYGRATELLGYVLAQESLPSTYKYLLDLQQTRLEDKLSTDEMQAALTTGSEMDTVQVAQMVSVKLP
jgi:hypothetical protein